MVMKTKLHKRIYSMYACVFALSYSINVQFNDVRIKYLLFLNTNMDKNH